ncbi:hypothetical protein GCM10023319_23210 [Nocardia iowensis]
MLLKHPLGSYVEVDDEYGEQLKFSGFQEVTSGTSRTGGRSKSPRKAPDAGRVDAGGDTP